jgi:hypothetical protein
VTRQVDFALTIDGERNRPGHVLSMLIDEMLWCAAGGGSLDINALNDNGG